MAGIDATIGIRELIWAAGKAFLAALVLTPIVRDIFRAYNVVDRPGVRKVHAYPIPRLGGISIAAAYAIGFAGLMPDKTVAWKLLPGAAVIFFTGILDDFFNIPPHFKLVGQIGAACAAFAAGLAFPGPLPLSFVVTVGWLLLCGNAFNLVDGLDGLCAGMGVVAAGAGFAAAWMGGNRALEYATLPLAAAALGFLCHNFSRATVFLGDSGALLIGFLAGCFGLMWTAQAAGPIAKMAPILALSIPLLDVLLSIARRFLAGRPIFSADRRHIHHRLLDRGLAPQKAVALLYLWAAIGAALALLLSVPALRSWQWLLLAIFAAVILAGVGQLRYPEFKMAGRLTIGGEFRRSLQAKVRAATLFEALDRARTEDEWWVALVGAAAQEGCSSVAWLRGETARREKVFSSETPAWSFRVKLNPDESVRLEGTAAAGPFHDLIAFARAAQSSFTGRSQTWEQPKLT